MRFLKNKITQAKIFEFKNNQRCSPQQDQPPTTIPQGNDSKKRKRVSGQCRSPESSTQTKNIVLNYGKAINKFSTSPFAIPYLTKILEKESVSLRGFANFVDSTKDQIDGFQHFRSILLPVKKDNKETAAYKRIYRDIGVVFIKFFCVNWIYNSKVQHKKTHLNFRFKMLRKIRLPELFTYLKFKAEKKETRL